MPLKCPLSNLYNFFPSHSMSILKVPIMYHMKILHFVKPLKAGFCLIKHDDVKLVRPLF
jgi:hypothetical protein